MSSPPAGQARRAIPWRDYAWFAGVPLLAAVVLFVLVEYTGIDRAFSDLFFDPVAKKFPLRHDWFLEVIGHHWAKYVLVVISFASLAAVLFSFGVAALRPYRRPLLFLFLAMTIGPMVVGHLKDTTNKHCPYDLDIYGGYAPHKSLLETADPGVERGRCWPGGHASGGFALMGLFFIWRHQRPRLALAGLGIGLGYGLMLGLGRTVQGAHFFSHNLWSAIIVWLVAWLLYELMLRRQSSIIPADPGASVRTTAGS